MKKLFLTVSLLLWAFSLPAAIITVDVNGQGDYTTIQDGIDAASNGDEVYVLDGTYNGFKNRNLSWSNKHITVRSLSGPDNCIIDCEESGRGFNLIDSNISNDDLIYGLTIRNGFVGQDENGAGIRCANGASPTIQNCIIKDNYSDNYAGNNHDNLGVGTYCEGSTIVKNCVIKDNYGMDIEGGAGIACKGDVTIENCTFSGNYLSFWLGIDNPVVNRLGHAIYVFDSSDLGNPQIINNEFYENYEFDSFTGYGVIVIESKYPHNFGDTLKITGNSLL
ncbi:MAG: hypothetical protein KGY75_08200, partial [Candidatus Cloacimonetes bacterium]|nr:hypothetical protein [Candidatus Cloacimonadota bacterium]